MKTPHSSSNLLPLATAALALLAMTVPRATAAIGTGGTILYTDASGANPRSSPPYAGGYVVHTFTSSGTLAMPFATTANVLVVGGGGGGGSNGGGGGGGGGVIYNSAYSLGSGSTTVTVGAGGLTHLNTTSNPTTGGNSVFGSLTALGGGGGSSRDNGGPGATGGSGGGGGGAMTSARCAAGTGTTGQGNKGGNGLWPDAGVNSAAGGGGGAGGAGIAGANLQGGNGGLGYNCAVFANIGGSPAGYFGGGGGGGRVVNGNNGSGGSGGGGIANVAGAANTGGGGGGGGAGGAGPQSGGSGIVMVRYPYVDGPLISTLEPANNATGVAGSANLVVTFDRNVQKATGTIVIKRSVDNSVIQTIDVTSGQITVSGAAATIVPTATLASGTQYDVLFPTGTFTAAADSTLAAGIVDTTIWRFTTAGSPMLASIVDNKSGGPVVMGQMVTYTVTFSGDMDGSTVTAADFGNAGSAAVTLGTVTETTSTSGVFTVPATPTSTGTLQLKVNAGTVMKNASGEALDTTSAILDDTIITVNADTIAPTPNPMTWASVPAASGTQIAMSATTATDVSGVEYSFECTAGGGHSSGWQNSATYTDTGLSAGLHTYRVRARDKSPAQNATGYSATASAIISQVGTFSSSATAPAVIGADIANLGASAGTDKWWVGEATRGQTFTTGATAVMLKALTYKIGAGQKNAAPATWTVRVGTMSGTTISPIAIAVCAQTVDSVVNAYITWTFGSPVLLAPNTLYGIDVGFTTAVDWHTGIPYIEYTGNTYAGGQFYSSGGSGAGGPTITVTAGQDRVFHLHLQDPMAPSPVPGTIVPAGNVTLGWTNLTPPTGTDVWVDVWFGTNPAALTQVVTKGLNTTTTTVNAPVAGTYYWRVDSYLNGLPTGTPATGTQFSFVVTDTDGDGIPDTWTNQYFGHPTAQASDLSRASDDPDSDGLTNLQEYQTGTSPINPDTDGDGLRDGVETNTGIWVSATNTGTNPLMADTDGDGLSDGVETNTGIWVSAANTGTNPLKVDTDGDGLSDGVETNTGIFVSASNTGTNPLLADSDGDGVGDWYEVTASYTDPNDAASKPKIPYPLPKPDGSTGATNKPVKVYIMSGQSNMVGMGEVNGSSLGTLNTVVKTQGKFPNLIDVSGNWSVRKDVYYRGVVTALGNAPLTAGQGSGGGTLGPELGFGHVMGYYHDEPVLLIKSSQGNRGLFWDILPPGSPRVTNGSTVYAGYGEAPNSWATGGGPSPYGWYAGKQYDDFFLAESDMGCKTDWANATSYAAGIYMRHNGVLYTCKAAHTSTLDSEPGVGAQAATYWAVYSIVNVTDVLDNFATEYPQWAAQGFEIAGYVWFQGNWDIGSDLAANNYETNLIQFIKQLRAYYANRYSGKCTTTTPFVLATGCGDPQTSGRGLIVANAQLAVGDPTKHPEFSRNVKTADTRGYWPDAAKSPTDKGYHYYGNAEAYTLIGDALGRAMIDLVGTTPAGYAAWAATNAPGSTAKDDSDGDGVSNGVEYVLGGTKNTNDGGNLPKISTSGGNLLFTFTRDQKSIDGSTVLAIEVGTNLANWPESYAVPDGAVSNGSGVSVVKDSPMTGVDTITLSIAQAPGTRKFVRLKVLVP